MKKGGGCMGRYEKKNKVVSTQERTEKKGCSLFNCVGKCTSSCIGTLNMKPLTTGIITK